VEGVITSWSGGTFDTKRNRLIVWGGGHKAYGGNEFYGFDLDDLKWIRINNPSKPTDCVDMYADTTPVARHTYGHPVYIEHLDRFFTAPGAAGFCQNGSWGAQYTWMFDFDNLKWTKMNPSGSASGGTGGSTYDPINNKVFVFGPSGLFVYDIASNSYTKLSSQRFYGNPMGVVDPKRKILVIINNNPVHVIDLTDPTFRLTQQSTSGGGASITDGDGGLNYDPVADKIVAWDGGPVWVLDTDTWQWSQKASCPQAKAANGTFGRFRYSPKENAYVVANGIYNNVYIYKLTSGAGTTDAALGMYSNRNHTISVSPNPFTNAVNIVVPGDAQEIAIYSINGRIKENLTVKGKCFSWNGAGQPAGIYLLKVRTASRVLQKKIFLTK
jgi:hypothetical protein